MELNENENISKVWGKTNMLKGKCVALSKYIRKKLKSQINNLRFHLKNLNKKKERKNKINPNQAEGKKNKKKVKLMDLKTGKQSSKS